MTDKPRTTIVSDPTEVAALKAAGKYREGIPLWGANGETLMVGEIEVLKEWRAKRTAGTEVAK